MSTDRGEEEGSGGMTTERKACPGCGGGAFWLMPDGTITCAQDDCYAPYPAVWQREEQAA